MRFNRSEPGIVLSGVAHAALFAVAVIGLWHPRPFDDQQEAIPVEMVTEAEMSQIARGERDGKKVEPTPQPKAERVAEINERKPDAPVAQRDVEAPAAPPPLPPRRDVDPDAEAAKLAEAKAETEAKERVEAQSHAEAQAKAEAQEKARAEAAARAEAHERARQAAAAAAAERARQAAADQARREAEARAAEEAEEKRQAEAERQRKAAEAKKAAEEKALREADAKALREKIDREQRAEEQRQAAEAAKAQRAAEAEQARKAAEAKRVAEARAKAAEEKKAADEKAKREAEAKAAAARQTAEQKPFNPTEIDKLLQNRQQAQSTGSTGPQPQRQASLGAPNATAPKLTPSEREQLIAYLVERIERCLSVPDGSDLRKRPEVRVVLNRDGSLAAPPAIVGGDRAVGAAAARAVRACAPYQIPARFAMKYEDWRDLIIGVDLSNRR